MNVLGENRISEHAETTYMLGSCAQTSRYSTFYSVQCISRCRRPKHTSPPNIGETAMAEAEAEPMTVLLAVL